MLKQFNKEVLTETIFLVFVAVVMTIYYNNTIRFDRFDQVFFVFIMYWALIIAITYYLYRMLSAEAQRIRSEREEAAQVEKAAVRDERAVFTAERQKDGKEVSLLNRLHASKVLIFVFFIGLYMFLSIWVDIFITTFFFLILSLWFYGTKLLHSLIFSLVVTAGCYAIFVLWLGLI